MSVQRKTIGYTKYSGTAKDICRQIVEKCYNGRYFQVSVGHFDHFYVRDFAYCCESLIKCGFKNKVRKTIDYSLREFEKFGRFTTTITKNGPEDIFAPTPESLSLMLRSVNISGYELSEAQRKFIENQAHEIYNCYYDKKNHLLRQNIWFSSIKDHAIRSSSTYNNSMLYLLADMMDTQNLKNPFDKEIIRKAILNHLHNGRFFFSDMSRKSDLSSDANIFPFWCGVIDGKKMFLEILKQFQAARLENPYPIKYTNKLTDKLALPYSLLAPNYEGNTIWMHLGLVFIEVLHKYSSQEAKKYIKILTNLVDKHKNFLELYNPDGTVYHTLLYSSDESMLWASMLLQYLIINE
ncbi:hypothetical protein K9M79_06270 [Candidatus Woesearchaeota archaeon]|nr:hypothetical protein [Candidatus Woesearchaeota archaeon]